MILHISDKSWLAGFFPLVYENVDAENCDVICISLIADENALRERLTADMERDI